MGPEPLGASVVVDGWKCVGMHVACRLLRMIVNGLCGCKLRASRRAFSLLMLILVAGCTASGLMPIKSRILAACDASLRLRAVKFLFFFYVSYTCSA